MVDEDDASDVEMDLRFWHDVMDLYFIRGRESRGRQDDDLVFFVRKMVRSSFLLLIVWLWTRQFNDKLQVFYTFHGIDFCLSFICL